MKMRHLGDGMPDRVVEGPSVTSPPERWTMGIRSTTAVDAAASASKRSPSSMMRSGFRRRKASTNPIIPRPMDLAVASAVSAARSMSTLALIRKPSASISR